jgi:predicted house-cleaning noncanonical NTP pyrophosphatase (MazG superfamily)
MSSPYNKLIRDKIPEIIERSGKKAVTERLDADKYKKFLDMKLGEELQEYLESDKVEELADLVEVIYAILEFKGMTLNEFDLLRKNKVEERGAFENRLFLKEVLDD